MFSRNNYGTNMEHFGLAGGARTTEDLENGCSPLCFQGCRAVGGLCYLVSDITTRCGGTPEKLLKKPNGTFPCQNWCLAHQVAAAQNCYSRATISAESSTCAKRPSMDTKK